MIDLSAMTFGMPRALFPVLALTVYHAGAAGTGLLYAAVAAGSTVAALTTGWLPTPATSAASCSSRSPSGAFIAVAGLVDTIWPAAALFALAGAADSVSAVCRSTISQTLTPDRMRGRMSSVFSLVVAGGPRLGDIESGTVAALDLARLLGRLRRPRLPRLGRPRSPPPSPSSPPTTAMRSAPARSGPRISSSAAERTEAAELG